MPVMRCPPRVPSVVMDAVIAVPLAPCHATAAFVAEKSHSTNPIRRHFARIKAGLGRSLPIMVTAGIEDHSASDDVPAPPERYSKYPWTRPRAFQSRKSG